MKILALDTSTEACSAALLVEDQISTCRRIAPRKHAALILPMIDSLLQAATLPLAALDAIAFGRGPGAFTGVRIAAGVTQGLAYGSDLPVIPISSLAALAQAAIDKAETIIAAIDARMGEIYYGQFSTVSGRAIPLCEERIGKPDQIKTAQMMQHATGSLYGMGSGWGTYEAVLLAHCQNRLRGYDAEALPLAEHILPLAIAAVEDKQAQPASQALPVYLRNQITD